MKALIIIVSIANGDPDLLNGKTIHAMKEGGQLILRTSENPLTDWLKQQKIAYSSLDDLYETSDDFDQLSSLIADRLWMFAKQRTVVYAVSDLMTDSTVSMLFRSIPHDGEIKVIPGVGMSSVSCASARQLFSGSDLRTVSATEFVSGDYNPNIPLLITELDNCSLAGDVKILLSSYLEDEDKVFYLHDHSCPVQISLFEIDRQPDIDHLSSVLIPGTDYMVRNRFVLDDLVHIMNRLRSQDGCPWDRIQTHQSLRPYMAEEAWECIAAIDQNDTDHLADELGDLLFQIVFHASIAQSFDEFSIIDVISAICRKMIRRHPHVFETIELKDPDSVSLAWEQIKQAETGYTSVLSSLDDVSSGLPALIYASKVLKKLRIAGIARSEPGPVLRDIMKIIDEMDSGSWNSLADNLGKLLLLCAELCQIKGQDSELVLHQMVDRLISILKMKENGIFPDGKSLDHLTFEDLGVYLNHVEDEIE